MWREMGGYVRSSLFFFLTFSCACAVAERGSNIMGIGNEGMGTDGN